MALSFFTLAQLVTTTASSSITVNPRRAPNPNTLVLVTVLNTNAAGTPVEPTGVVGCNMVFSLVTSSVTYDPTGASALHNLSVWRSMSGAPDTSQVTASIPATNTGYGILLTEVSGVSTSGLSGANAVGQSATSRVDGSSALTVFAPSSASSANGWFLGFSYNVNGSGGLSISGMPTLEVGGFAGPPSEIGSAYTDVSTWTSPKITQSTATNYAGIMVELVADNPSVDGGGLWAYDMRGHTPRVFTPQLIGDRLVLPGDIRSLDPANDTWEGEAT